MFRLCPGTWQELNTLGTTSSPLFTVLSSPSVFIHQGGEVRPTRENQTRVAIVIPLAGRKKPACYSTQGGLLSGSHKNLESSANQTAEIGRSQWDESLQPGWQMPGGLQLFWDASRGCFISLALVVSTYPG